MIDDGFFLLSITPSLTRFGRTFQLQLPPDKRDGSVASLLHVDSSPYLWAHQYRLNLPLELASGVELSAGALFDRLSPADRKRGEIPQTDEIENGVSSTEGTARRVFGSRTTTSSSHRRRPVTFA